MPIQIFVGSSSICNSWANHEKILVCFFFKSAANVQKCWIINRCHMKVLSNQTKFLCLDWNIFTVLILPVISCATVCNVGSYTWSKHLCPILYSHICYTNMQPLYIQVNIKQPDSSQHLSILCFKYNFAVWINGNIIRFYFYYSFSIVQIDEV